MSRLIRDTHLITDIKKWQKEAEPEEARVMEDVICLIEDQPTAYDVDRVVAELEDEYEWNADCFHGTEGMEYLGQMRAYDNAIRIVKRGGRVGDTE